MPPATARTERYEIRQMSLLISLDEPLAERLRQEASEKEVTPEQAARELLGHALDRIAQEKAWREANRRRIDLINKSRQQGLTAEEGASRWSASAWRRSS